jgi:hypothetical protein
MLLVGVRCQRVVVLLPIDEQTRVGIMRSFCGSVSG